MTNEEAIKVLRKDRALCLFNPMTGETEPMNDDCRVSAEAIGTAIEALEKQIPKKPAKQWGNNVCPNCRTDTQCRVVMGWEKHCPDCGQAIDWSADE